MNTRKYLVIYLTVTLLHLYLKLLLTSTSLSHMGHCTVFLINLCCAKKYHSLCWSSRISTRSTRETVNLSQVEAIPGAPASVHVKEFQHAKQWCVPTQHKNPLQSITWSLEPLWLILDTAFTLDPLSTVQSTDFVGHAHCWRNLAQATYLQWRCYTRKERC